MKKLLTILTLVALVFSMAAVSFAEESTAVKTEVVTLNEMLSNPKDLVYQDAGGKTVELTGKNGVYERGIASGKGDSPSAPVFSSNKKYLNEIFSVDMEFNFEDGGENDSFNAFQLRAADNNKVCWTTNCYCIIVKKGSVEIQSFKDSNIFYLNTDAEIPENEKVNVMFGAVNTDMGVYIFIKIGNNIYGALDTNSTITESGYMNIEWRTKFKAYDTKEDKISIPVSKISYDAKNSNITEELVIINGGEAEDCTAKERKWYLSTDAYEPDIKSQFDHYFDDMFTVIDGENRENLSVMPGDIGLYAVGEITTDSDLKVRSNAEYISAAEYLLAKGVAGIVDCNTLFANGKYIKYDEANEAVTAIEENGVIYVPVRAIVEAYNHPVGWDGDLQMVYIDAKEAPDPNKDFHTYDSSFKIGDLGWTAFRMLMGSNMAAKPIIYEDRAMLAYNDVGSVLDFKAITFDEALGLFTYSDIPLNFTDEDKAFIVDYATYGPLE